MAERINLKSGWRFCFKNDNTLKDDKICTNLLCILKMFLKLSNHIYHKLQDINLHSLLVLIDYWYGLMSIYALII